LRRDRAEELFERDAAPAGRQAIERLAGLEAAARHVAELDVRDVGGRDIVDRSEVGAAAPEMVGVEQEPAARMSAASVELTNALQAVELLRLRVEFEGEPHAVAGRDRGHLAQARRRFREIAAAPIDGTHHRRRAERLRTLALLGEDLEQPAALGAA